MAVASVLFQTQPDLELIVVDDGSTDGTAAIVEGIVDPRIRIVSQVNKSLPAARNAGIGVARGRLIAFRDSDDIWLPRYLELTERALAGKARPGFAYTDPHQFDPVTGKVRISRASDKPLFGPSRANGQEFLLRLLARNFLWVSTVVT